MKIRAYSELYLSDAMKNLGEALDYAVNFCHLEIGNFMDLFIATGFADSFGRADPRIIAGISGTELVIKVLKKINLNISFPVPDSNYEYSSEYWCGWILAYYQWKTARRFGDIIKDVPMKEIQKLYPTLHEASEEKFVDTLNAITRRKNNISRLQQCRKARGYSQKKLSELSGINLRTLQQYESKAKNINKASISAVLAIAHVLGCRVGDILEV